MQKKAANVSETKYIIFHIKDKHINPNIKILYDASESDIHNSAEIFYSNIFTTTSQHLTFPPTNYLVSIRMKTYFLTLILNISVLI